ncbi:MAG: cupin domain-containing protein [bacterium]|nr:cupin domain-containing protein [bacterium]
MQRTSLEGIWMWSRWQPDRQLSFNSFFLRGDGGVVVDPLPIEEEDLAAINTDGGARWVVVTNRDHERDARAVADRLGAELAAPAADVPQMRCRIDRELRDGESLGRVRVVALDGMKSPGEVALHVADARAVIVGDALFGDPAGAVRLPADEKLGDPKRALLSLRRVLALQPQHLLVGDGACIYGNAGEVIGAYLSTRGDVYVNRINIEELRWESFESDPHPFGGSAAEIGTYIGAHSLGYHLVKLPPGKAWCPLHWHEGDEEMFFMMEGTATLRTPRGEYAVRRGDFIAFPAGPAGAHQLRNDGDADCTVLMLADNADGEEVCHYPDSRKVFASMTRLLVRAEPQLDYYDGETAGST